MAFLKANGGVSAITTQVHPLRIPQDKEPPAITYQRVDGPRERSQSGPSGLAHPRIQLNCWGSNYTEAKRLAEKVRYALDGFRGDMAGRYVSQCRVEDDRDDFESATERERVIVDVIIWHREEVA